MNRVFLVVSVVLGVALVCGCGLKTRDRHHGPEPEAVEVPEEDDSDDLDIENGIETDAVEQEAPLPMETEFLVWDVHVDETPHPGRIRDALTRTLKFTFDNTLDRLLTGQIVIEAPPGVSLVPGKTVGWRLRGGRSAEIPVQLVIIEGAPLGRVTLPVTITVLGETYRSRQLELYKWLDVRCIGPFPAGADGGFSTAYPPEDGVDFDRACQWEGTEFVWRRLPLEGLHPDGMVDFNEIFGEGAEGCAYAALGVHAEAATGVMLAFACDSPSTVWLDEQQVINAPEPLEEEAIVEVLLEKGRNTLLVKCCAAEDGWAFVLGVVGKQRELPSGVAFDLVLRQAPESDTDDAEQAVAE